MKFSTVEKTLRTYRQKKYRTSPRTCAEIIESFKDPTILSDIGSSLHREHYQIYNHVHEEKDFSYCVLSSKKSIDLIKKNTEVNERVFLIDGTFRITPMSNVFKQVVIIHAQFGIKVKLSLYAMCIAFPICPLCPIFISMPLFSYFPPQSFPLVMIMMSNRTTDAYKSAFSYVHNEILPLDAKAIITDFELALRKAMKAIVPDTKLLGCWFHHNQALNRKRAANFKLFVLVKNNQEAKILYRKFQCLALLPATKIKPAFDELAFEALQKFPEFESFVKYYDKQWIRKEKPKSYSVFLQVIFDIIHLVHS